MTQAEDRPAPKLALGHRIARGLRSPRLLTALIAVLTAMILLRGEDQIGYVRDEGVYFEASRHYAAWVVRWLDEGRAANVPEIRDRYFGINHEHPALMKLACPTPVTATGVADWAVVALPS